MKAIEEVITSGSADSSAKPQSIVRLGDMLGELMEDKIAPRQGLFESVVAVWADLLPAELRKHSRIVDISAGTVKVVVDSPSYMYELQLCKAALLKQLRRQCPKARLQTIKLVVG